MRVSNFLLWQIAYAEIWVTDALVAGLPRAPPARGHRRLPEARSPLRRDRIARRRRPKLSKACDGDPRRSARPSSSPLIVATLVAGCRRGRRVALAVAAAALAAGEAGRARAARSARAVSRRVFVGIAPRRRSLSRLPWRSSTCVTGDDLARRRAARELVASGTMALAAGPADVRRRSTRAAVAFMAPLYVGLPLGALGMDARHGRAAACSRWLLVVIAVSDSAQYYTGRAFGRRKLAPAVSPAKTVEGAIGGLVAARSPAARSGAGCCPVRATLATAPSLGAARRAVRHGRRSLRVAAQAQRRREGQLGADSRPRRRARSHRQLSVRGAVLLRRS